MTNICFNELRPYLSINYMFITIIFLVLCAKKKVNCLFVFCTGERFYSRAECFMKCFEQLNSFKKFCPVMAMNRRRIKD